LSAYYLDTSALAKRYLVETGTSWVRNLTARSSGHVIVICDLTPVEFFSLSARRLREKKLTVADVITLQTTFIAHHEQDYLSTPLEKSVLTLARAFVSKYPLRPPDAIQLASAIDAVVTLGEPITFICADQDLLAAAQAEGLKTDNPNFYP
jgi:hypothetical protein